jgi:hypothetical protein
MMAQLRNSWSSELMLRTALVLALSVSGGNAEADTHLTANSNADNDNGEWLVILLLLVSKQRSAAPFTDSQAHQSISPPYTQPVTRCATLCASPTPAPSSATTTVMSSGLTGSSPSTRPRALQVCGFANLLVAVLPEPLRSTSRLTHSPFSFSFFPPPPAQMMWTYSR